MLADGTLDSKIFVIVGALPDMNYLGIRATSKKRWRSYQPEDGADYYFIPAGRLNGLILIVGFYSPTRKNFNAVMFKKKMEEGKAPHPERKPFALSDRERTLQQDAEVPGR